MADNKIRDLFTQLKTTIVGTKTSKVDTALDTAVRDIVSYKSNSGRNGYIDLVRTVIAKSANNMAFGANGLYAGTQSGGLGPAALGQGSRMMRYKTYAAIVSNINYAYRALNVLTDNILSPDDITKISLDVKPATYLEDETPTESKVKRVKQIIQKIKLENALNGIVKNTLMYGDYFCEISNAKTALTSKSLLSEAAAYQSYISDNVNMGLLHTWNTTVKIGTKEKTFKFSLDMTSLREAENETNSKKDPNTSLANISLVYHKPKLVVKLKSALFPICFGYLVFPEIKGINTSGTPLEDDAVNNICISILQNLKKKLPQMDEFHDDKELLDILNYMVSHSHVGNIMQIRYIPPDRMVHFHIPSSKYEPYGESIYDASQFMAKVLISLETALTVSRLSRSTEKRKVAVEIGLPRDAQKTIQAMKEEFRKRKVSLDSFGTVDTIPSMITTFEDVYIPQKDGKPFVDISTFNEGNTDIRSKVDELKFMRDSLIATYSVPPSFLGIEENLSNKSALSEENILFARAVIGHQKYLNIQIVELLQKVFDIVDPDTAMTVFDNVTVHLPVPKSLQYEREARYTNEIVGLIEGLERIGVPKEYSKKKYLANYDWKEIEKYAIDDKVEKSLDPSKNEDETGMGGIGGIGGGGMGGF